MTIKILQSYSFGEWFTEIHVNFFIRSSSKTPSHDEISDYIGIQPTRGMTKGQRYLAKGYDPKKKKPDMKRGGRNLLQYGK